MGGKRKSKSTERKYFHIKVIEAQGLVVKTNAFTNEPVVTLKLKGTEKKQKKSTTSHCGREWWDEVFKFETVDFQNEWIKVEAREKGYYFCVSYWIGEVHIRIRDYLDGRVHQQWFPLNAGSSKLHQKPKGAIHLSLRLTDNICNH